MTDFPTEALLGRPGVICTPHLGASTPEAEDNCAVMAAQEISDYLKNGNITHSVNMPEVYQPRAGGKRICIIHKNEPGMISQITALTTEAGLMHWPRSSRPSLPSSGCVSCDAAIKFSEAAALPGRRSFRKRIRLNPVIDHSRDLR